MGGGGGVRWAQLELTDALFLTDDEALTIVGNAHCVIPENLVFKKTTEKRRREIIQDLLSSDPRNKHEQVWTLEKKNKKRGQVPRCRTCRKIQNEDEFTVTDKGLYVPYEQNFVTETMFWFFSGKTMHK